MGTETYPKSKPGKGKAKFNLTNTASYGTRGVSSGSAGNYGTKGVGGMGGKDARGRSQLHKARHGISP